jgi:hypothetical protein
MCRHAAQDEQVGENTDDVGRIQAPGYPDHQSFPRKFVNNVQHPDLPPVMCAVLDKIIGPDVIWTLRPQPDARTFIQPKT